MPKETFPLRSSWLVTGSYDPDTEELDVTMAAGQTYTHPGVPRQVVDEFKAASSAGSYYNNFIKGVYG